MENQIPFLVHFQDGRNVEVKPSQAKSLDFMPLADGSFHILHENKAYRAEVLNTDHAARAFVIRVNGTQFKLHLADKYERLVQQMGLNIGGSQRFNEVKAPMPGLVLNILVEVGQEVKKGEGLIILEAMKMENVLKCPTDARIKAIKVVKGAPVEKGSLLIEFDN